MIFFMKYQEKYRKSLQKILRICLLFFVYMSIVSCSYAWMDVNAYNDFYKYDVEPRIDVFCKDVLIKAKDIFSFQRPLLKVRLTQAERYFSKDSMEFFGERGDGKPVTSQYSGVIWLGVWCDEKTLVKGWAKEDQKFHVEYIYTRDPQMLFIGGIHVGASTTVIERFFNARIQDISVKNSIIRYPFLGNDDFSVPVLELTYDKGVIECIEVWDGYVPHDNVPVVPRISNIDDFVSIKTEELSGTKIKSELRTQQNPKWFSIAQIIILCLIGVAIISALIGLVLEHITSKAIGSDNLLPPEQPAENFTQEAEVIDAEFTDSQQDDYEYPYEDISKVVGEGR